MSTLPKYVVGVAVIVTRGGRVLGLQRTADARCAAGVWETVSGKIEIGEHPLGAAIREVGEECGLTVEFDPRPVAVIQARRGPDPMILIVYRAVHVAGELVLSREHARGGWLTADEFRGLCCYAPMHDLVRDALAAAEVVEGLLPSS